MTSERFWKSIGGRKMGNGYLFSILISVAAYRIDPFPFEPYAMWLAAGLLGIAATVAVEDRKGSRPPGARRASDRRREDLP